MRRIAQVVSAYRLRLTAIVTLGVFVLLAQPGRAADALNYTKNYFVTGDYKIAGVGLRGTGVNGFATGTITMSGVPEGADIVAAFLYWETIESAPSPATAKGFFRGSAIVGSVRGNPANAPCWSSGGTTGPAGSTGRVYRADVLRYLDVDHINNVRVANGPHTVKLPDSGGNGNGNITLTNGASLVVIYRVMTPGTPLRSVVVYDGAFTMTKGSAAMTQTMTGFYQASGTGAKMTQIVANGQAGHTATLSVNGATLSTNPFPGERGVRWDNFTLDPIALAADAASFQTEVTTPDNQTCLTWSAIVASMIVTDTDGDGLLNTWETNGLHLNPGSSTQPATFGGCLAYPSDPCVNLPAMGALPNVKDIFIELDWLHGNTTASGAEHTHIPKLDALNMVGTAFNAQGIKLHFDVGNNYQSPVSPYIIPYVAPATLYTRGGGEVIEESTLLCPNVGTSVCAYVEPYAVIGWKIGFRAVKDGFPVLNMPSHFARNRKDIFHYVLFAHALAGPFDPTTGRPTSTNPASVSGVADRPGADLMVTLGLWRSDIPANDQVGSTLVQAGTLMHELGHNLGLSHAGVYRTPNCMPNYPSVMNYLYQTRGLTDGLGGQHIDYSFGALSPLNETMLSETTPLGPLNYRVRYYGPKLASDPPGSAAQLHCDGTPILDGAQMIRLENSLPGFIDWNHDGVPGATSLSEDLNFNGLLGDGPVGGGLAGTSYLVDSNDWGNLNLRQVGARLNVNGLSADVHLGQQDLGQQDLGQQDLGQQDLGQQDLGQQDLGQTEQGGTGDVTFEAHVLSTIDPPPPPSPDCPDCGLKATNKIDRIALTWIAPSTGSIDHYNVYRSDVAHPIPARIGSVPGGPGHPTGTFDDVVDSVGTLYNTTYTYSVTSVVSVFGVLNESAFSNPANGIAKHLFVIARNPSRLYGDANPTLFDVSGMDLPAPADVTCTTAATMVSNVGTWAITCSGPATTSSAIDGITYTNGTLTITPRPITVTADSGQNKTYGAPNPVYSYSLTSGGPLVGSDTFSGALTRDAGENVGSYAITQGSLALGGNYTLTYIGASFTISQASQTISFTAPPPASKAYQGTFPVAATATSGLPVTLGVSTPSVCSISGGIVIMLSGTGTCTVTANQAGNGMYNMAPTLTRSTTATKVALTGTAGNKTKVYGAPLPAFTLNYLGFVSGETAAVLSGTLSCVTTATAISPVSGSPYPITCSGQSSPNYSITYVPGSLSVTKTTPIFSGLSSPNIAEHTTSTTVGGKISYAPAGGSPVFPSGTVSIVLHGVTKLATIAANGTFSADFSTRNLEDGTFTITFNYTSTDGNFNSALGGSSTLSVHD